MLTKEKILDTTEQVLQRFGPRKTTVVDVARELNVSHGTVYRHYKSKAALHEALTKRWLERVTEPLLAIRGSDDSPLVKLRQWFETLAKIKQQRAKDEPEMFDSYSIIAQGLPKEVLMSHLDLMIAQVADILSEGVDVGCFNIEDCNATARAMFFGTVRYHHPMHIHEWTDPNLDADFDKLFSLFEAAISA